MSSSTVAIILKIFSATVSSMDISVLLSLLYLSFYSLEFSYHQYFGNKKRRTTKVIRRIFSNRVFYAGRQPRYPAEYHKVLVINLPSRSTALTCRHTETFPVHLYYTQLRLKYQLEFRFFQKFIFFYGIRPHKLLVVHLRNHYRYYFP